MALFIELLLMGVGLAMDAFAVSVCKGLEMKKLNKKQAVVIGLYFGGFQALMPLVGWILGIQFQKYITSIDHWLAFILLGFIGGKMILEAVKDWNEEEICGYRVGRVAHDCAAAGRVWSGADHPGGSRGQQHLHQPGVQGGLPGPVRAGGGRAVVRLLHPGHSGCDADPALR